MGAMEGRWGSRSVVVPRNPTSVTVHAQHVTVVGAVGAAQILKVEPAAVLPYLRVTVASSIQE